ncbi:MAG: hypothetical protein RL693_1600 [Verrucomicrobiota bacterium]|jgi:hypothetical protein
MNPHPSSDPFARLEELLLESHTRELFPQEQAELNEMLRSHADARSHAARFLIDDAALTDSLREAQVEAIFREEGEVLSHLRDQLKSKPTTFKWFQWRPLTAAAAGLVIGCFSTSMVWALNTQGWNGGLHGFFIPLGNPGFERQETLPQVHLVPKVDQWTGFDTEIVPGGGTRPEAKEGMRMIRLGAAPAGKGYFANLMVDLTQSRPETTKPLQIEITASFHASEPGHNEHYLLRALTSKDDAGQVSDQWDANWREMEPLALTTAGKAIFPTAAEPGWHTITVRLDVPPSARTLVISLGSNTPGPAEGRTNHFMDDVKASWLIHDTEKPIP